MWRKLVKIYALKFRWVAKVQARKAPSRTEGPTVGTGVEAERKISPLSEI